MLWRFWRAREDGPQPPVRKHRRADRRKHDACGQEVAFYPNGRPYPHSPCDSRTRDLTQVRTDS